jgi:hypothetical protein
MDVHQNARLTPHCRALLEAQKFFELSLMHAGDLTQSIAVCGRGRRT